MRDGGVFEDDGGGEDVREKVAGAGEVVGYEGDLAEACWVVGWHCRQGGAEVWEESSSDVSLGCFVVLAVCLVDRLNFRKSSL